MVIAVGDYRFSICDWLAEGCPTWSDGRFFLYDDRVVAILVTGMSGVGKSTVLNHLEQRGYRVVDTDFGGWVEEIPTSDGTGVERQWREGRIDGLLTEHERSGEPLFIFGTVWNQSRFYSRFAHVVLLSAPLEVMFERIAGRSDNPFGKTDDQRARIAADTAEVEPLLRATATVEIDTRKPIVEVVDQLAALCGPPPSR
ncbi:AAA family ATPase [Saccharothrix luteola]|uniref:AAA family ATPase n=1 Tax=Saccharothrix luteola TaxID=2893018 RepID=UPI001E308981|nr:AAA family ATPase [Saccharothrix luteola]MCC8242877.1 AAA family ATPase [Saccharothrix luteola]